MRPLQIQKPVAKRGTITQKQADKAVRDYLRTKPIGYAKDGTPILRPPRRPGDMTSAQARAAVQSAKRASK